MQTITLKNSFHGTSANVRVDPKITHETLAGTRSVYLDRLSPSQRRRVRRELCGSKDCACGVVR